MQEAELIKQLNKLSEIKPDNDWKEKNRQVLLSQVLSGANEDIKKEDSFLTTSYYFFDIYVGSQIARLFSMPALTVCLIVIAVFGSGLYSYQAAQDTKPGDSLYIAKKISEKTQFALTFDEKEKAKLSVSFATNRTKEIAEFVKESESGEDTERVEKLKEDFKKEIEITRNRLEKISKMNENSVPVKSGNETKEDTGTGTSATGNSGVQTEVNEDNNEVFSANLGKNDQRLEVSDSKADAKASGTPKSDSDKKATSTKEVVKEERTSPSKMLEEAEKLFDKNDYEGTINKLEEVNEMLDKTSKDNEGSDFKNATTGTTTN